MVLPGIQAVFGFQLIAAFNNRFQNLKPMERLLHLGAIAIALIMAPASYHRIAEKGIVSRRFVELVHAYSPWRCFRSCWGYRWINLSSLGLFSIA